MSGRFTLGLIGAGNMAEAVARGAAAAGILKADQMLAADPSPQRRAVFDALGAATTADNDQLVGSCESLLLAVKPQSLESLAPALGRIDAAAQTVISIMAGRSSEKIESVIGRPARVVRVMPNTPLMVGLGMAGVALGKHARAGDDELAMRIFAACGKAIRVDEAELDAITAVSGSGPAYLFYLAEAMEAAAAELGLADHARLLVSQTLLGASQLLAASDESPAELRRKVTSPGGTTQAAMEVLDHARVKDALSAAVRAARDRSLELGA